MKELTCCFTGHRIIAKKDLPEIQTNLENAIVKLIKEEGVRYFGAGGALGFDTLAAQTVLRLKKTYPDIRLILVLPCKDQTKGWRPNDKFIYDDILALCDKYIYTSEEYSSGCMHKRNRHLVDNSSYCICYLNKASGGTYYTVNYALKNGLKLINVAPEAEPFDRDI